jgi:hypothetical protein
VRDDQSVGSRGVGEPGAEAGYEPPSLVPIGNLSDLLAGNSDSGCDSGISQTQGPMPRGSCV